MARSYPARASGPEPSPGLLRRRSTRVVLVLAALAIALLVGAPFAIQYALQRWLVEHGAETARIGNVDFNPFTGSLVIEGAKVTRNGSSSLTIQRARVRVAWLPLWHKRLQLDAVAVEHADLSVSRSKSGLWRIAGLALPSFGRLHQSFSWGISLDSLQLSDTRIHYADPSTHTVLAIKNALLNALSSWQHQQPAQLTIHGSLGGGSVALQAQVRAFASEPTVNGKLSVHGFKLATVAGHLQTELTELTGVTDLDGTFKAKLHGDGTLSLSHSGTASLSMLHLRSAHAVLDDDKIAWAGSAELEFVPGYPGPSISADGHLDATGIDLNDSARKSKTTITHANWQGQLGFGRHDVPTGYEMRGDLTLDGVTLRDPAEARGVLRLRRLAANTIHTRGTYDIRMRELNFADVTLGNPPAAIDGPPLRPPLHIATAKLRNVALRDLSHLSVADMIVDGVSAQIKRDQTGKWHGLDGRALASAADSPERIDTGLAQRTIRIDRLQLTGNSQIHFQDDSFKPAYRTTVAIESANLERLDSAKPGDSSLLSLSAKIGKYTQARLQGKIAPFASQLRLALTGKIHNLDLPPLSGYATRNLGYGLDSGHLDADVKIDIDYGKLTGSSALVLSNLKIVPSDSAKMRSLTSSLTISLDTALDMLRDRDNDIRLQIPVSGRLNDPRFNLANTINQALANSLQLAALSYVKLALQPYGAIIAVAQLANNAASAVQLQPILFQAGNAAIPNDAAPYLRRIAKLMKARPELRVRICGNATESDRRALHTATTGNAQATGSASTVARVADERLLTLARRRAAAIKQQLATQLGIKPARLFVCRPQLDLATGAEPKVKLLI